MNLDDSTSHALVLRSVKFAWDPKKNLLPDEVIIANVLATPTVVENDSNVIFQTTTNNLLINGTGFNGAKMLDLYFKPPLIRDVVYEIVSSFPLSKEQVVLRLCVDYKWLDYPGPLYVIGVDTGGGPVKINGDIGFKIADVQADIDLHNTSGCDNSCPYSRDGVCDDLRGTSFCKLGSDCQVVIILGI